MSYIEELRQVVGNRPLIMVGASVLITNSVGQLLLLRRTDNSCWGIPGGAMEPGETVEQTARRETLEETGLEPGLLSLFGVFSGSDLYYRYPNGAEVYNVSIAYRTEEVKGRPNLNPVEHSEMRYFDLQDLPTEISPPIRPIITKYVEAQQNYASGMVQTGK